MKALKRGDQDDFFAFFEREVPVLLSSAAHGAAGGGAMDETRCEDGSARQASSCESQMSL